MAIAMRGGGGQHMNRGKMSQGQSRSWLFKQGLCLDSSLPRGKADGVTRITQPGLEEMDQVSVYLYAEVAKYCLD
jgi:hypothetical protein